MVQEDERKMDALTRRATELTMVNNNSKLLNEMLDHYDKNSSGNEEKELLKELYQSCEKMEQTDSRSRCHGFDSRPLTSRRREDGNVTNTIC